MSGQAGAIRRRNSSYTRDDGKSMKQVMDELAQDFVRTIMGNQELVIQNEDFMLVNGYYYPKWSEGDNEKRDYSRPCLDLSLDMPLRYPRALATRTAYQQITSPRTANYVLELLWNSRSNRGVHVNVTSQIIDLLDYRTFGHYPGELQGLSSVAVTNNSYRRILVTSSQQQWICKYERNGAFVSKFGRHLRKCPAEIGCAVCTVLTEPLLLAVCPITNQIVVVDRIRDHYRHHIHVFDETGQVLKYGLGSRVLRVQPSACQVDRLGNIVLLQGTDKRISVISKDDDVVRDFICSWLVSPVDLVTSKSGEIFVADEGRNCVSVFNDAGILLRELGGPSDTPRPIALAIDHWGGLLVASNRPRFSIVLLACSDGTVARRYKNDHVPPDFIKMVANDLNDAILVNRNDRIYSFNLGLKVYAELAGADSKETIFV